ncbi:MAG TPA: phage terminase large subunit [Stellaceae bacterium]|nr:phage terminase large subunit [Stellaceae bacterium]
MSDRAIARYHDILRCDLYAFILKAFLELNPAAKFLPPAFLDIIVDRLEKVRRGEIKRLIINQPPRTLKSHCVSIVFPAWILGHDPTTQIICASYGQELADKFARDCKNLMTAPFYESLFATRLSPQKQATAEYETTDNGGRLSTSVGGMLTGRGADLIIIDDPLKPDEAVSDVARAAVNGWYDNTLYSRLNDKKTGAIIIVAQRLHEDDLVGHVLRQEPWQVLSFPAIAEEDEDFTVTTPYGRWRYSRKIGKALHPEREPLEALERIRQTIGPYNFAGQYQQTPAPLGGGMIKQEWFKRYDRLPGKFDRVMQSWDTASVAAELNSFSVCTTWGELDKQLYLLHVLRKRLNYPELKCAVREQASLHNAKIILIEYRASGIQLFQELARELRGVTKYEPEDEKKMRMQRQTGLIESGAVHLPREDYWLADYLHELVIFPNGTYSDQVDSTSQALDWIQRQWGTDYSPWVEYYGRLAARARGLPLDDEAASIKYVRMRAHPNLGYQGSTGDRPWHYVASAEGIIEKVHRSDVERLQRMGCALIEEEEPEE